jgi:hypothetical protein
VLQAVKRKEKYVRANDATLLPIDRTVGNLLEWMPMFLGFFWMSMALTSDGVTFVILLPVCYASVYISVSLLTLIMQLCHVRFLDFFWMSMALAGG